MKSKLNTVLLFSISLFVLFNLTSCESDGYSLGDHYGSIATVQVGDNGHAHSFTLDNGETMFVAATATNYKPEYERVLIDYTILGKDATGYEGYDYVIKLNRYFEDILTKPIIYVAEDDEEQQKVVGYDKIKVASIYAKGEYITIRFGINMAGKDKHLLNLVALNENKEQQGDEPIKLEFRHNKNNDEEHYASGLSHVCFKIDDYIAANQDKESITFEVSWVEYNGETKIEKLKYTLPPLSVVSSSHN